MPDPGTSELREHRLRHSVQDGKGKGILDLLSKEQVPIPGQGASEAVNLKRVMPLQLVKDDIDQCLSELPEPSSGDMDRLPPHIEDLEPAPEDLPAPENLNPAESIQEHVGRQVFVLGFDIIHGDESAMPLHLQLHGVHSANVAPEENMMENGEVEH